MDDAVKNRETAANATPAPIVMLVRLNLMAVIVSYVLKLTSSGRRISIKVYSFPGLFQRLAIDFLTDRKTQTDMTSTTA
jgi:hypothetical protein